MMGRPHFSHAHTRFVYSNFFGSPSPPASLPKFICIHLFSLSLFSIHLSISVFCFSYISPSFCSSCFSLSLSLPLLFYSLIIPLHSFFYLAALFSLLKFPFNRSSPVGHENILGRLFVSPCSHPSPNYFSHAL